jgi:hypothetical protein
MDSPVLPLLEASQTTAGQTVRHSAKSATTIGAARATTTAAATKGTELPSQHRVQVSEVQTDTKQAAIPSISDSDGNVSTISESTSPEQVTVTVDRQHQSAAKTEATKPTKQQGGNNKLMLLLSSCENLNNPCEAPVVDIRNNIADINRSVELKTTEISWESDEHMESKVLCDGLLLFGQGENDQQIIGGKKGGTIKRDKYDTKNKAFQSSNIMLPIRSVQKTVKQHEVVDGDQNTLTCEKQIAKKKGEEKEEIVVESVVEEEKKIEKYLQEINQIDIKLDEKEFNDMDVIETEGETETEDSILMGGHMSLESQNELKAEEEEIFENLENMILKSVKSVDEDAIDNEVEDVGDVLQCICHRFYQLWLKSVPIQLRIAAYVILFILCMILSLGIGILIGSSSPGNNIDQSLKNLQYTPSSSSLINRYNGGGSQSAIGSDGGTSTSTTMISPSSSSSFVIVAVPSPSIAAAAAAAAAIPITTPSSLNIVIPSPSSINRGSDNNDNVVIVPSSSSVLENFSPSPSPSPSLIGTVSPPSIESIKSPSSSNIIDHDSTTIVPSPTTTSINSVPSPANERDSSGTIVPSPTTTPINSVPSPANERDSSGAIVPSPTTISINALSPTVSPSSLTIVPSPSSTTIRKQQISPSSYNNMIEATAPSPSFIRSFLMPSPSPITKVVTVEQEKVVLKQSLSFTSGNATADSVSEDDILALRQSIADALGVPLEFIIITSITDNSHDDNRRRRLMRGMHRLSHRSSSSSGSGDVLTINFQITLYRPTTRTNNNNTTNDTVSSSRSILTSASTNFAIDLSSLIKGMETLGGESSNEKNTTAALYNVLSKITGLNEDQITIKTTEPEKIVQIVQVNTIVPVVENVSPTPLQSPSSVATLSSVATPSPIQSPSPVTTPSPLATPSSLESQSATKSLLASPSPPLHPLTPSPITSPSSYRMISSPSSVSPSTLISAPSSSIAPSKSSDALTTVPSSSNVAGSTPSSSFINTSPSSKDFTTSNDSSVNKVPSPMPSISIDGALTTPSSIEQFVSFPSPSSSSELMFLSTIPSPSSSSIFITSSHNISPSPFVKTTPSSSSIKNTPSSSSIRSNTPSSSRDSTSSVEPIIITPPPPSPSTSAISNTPSSGITSGSNVTPRSATPSSSIISNILISPSSSVIPSSSNTPSSSIITNTLKNTPSSSGGASKQEEDIISPSNLVYVLEFKTNIIGIDVNEFNTNKKQMTRSFQKTVSALLNGVDVKDVYDIKAIEMNRRLRRLGEGVVITYKVRTKEKKNINLIKNHISNNLEFKNEFILQMRANNIIYTDIQIYTDTKNIIPIEMDINNTGDYSNSDGDNDKLTPSPSSSSSLMLLPHEEISNEVNYTLTIILSCIGLITVLLIIIVLIKEYYRKKTLTPSEEVTKWIYEINNNYESDSNYHNASNESLEIKIIKKKLNNVALKLENYLQALCQHSKSAEAAAKLGLGFKKIQKQSKEIIHLCVDYILVLLTRNANKKYTSFIVNIVLPAELIALKYISKWRIRIIDSIGTRKGETSFLVPTLPLNMRSKRNAVHQQDIEIMKNMKIFNTKKKKDTACLVDNSYDMKNQMETLPELSSIIKRDEYKKVITSLLHSQILMNKTKKGIVREIQRDEDTSSSSSKEYIIPLMNNLNTLIKSQINHLNRVMKNQIYFTTILNKSLVDTKKQLFIMLNTIEHDIRNIIDTNILHDEIKNRSCSRKRLFGCYGNGCQSSTVAPFVDIDNVTKEEENKENNLNINMASTTTLADLSKTISTRIWLKLLSKQRYTFECAAARRIQSLWRREKIHQIIHQRNFSSSISSIDTTSNTMILTESENEDIVLSPEGGGRKKRREEKDVPIENDNRVKLENGVNDTCNNTIYSTLKNDTMKNKKVKNFLKKNSQLEKQDVSDRTSSISTVE